jgi:uncharacterized protein YjbI with pentapeptide repeats
MTKLENTTLKDSFFSDCKILGVDFSKCSKFLFSIKCEDCILNYSTFYKNDLKNTTFKNCVLKEASFIETNMTATKFINCDLENALFERTILEKADFSTAKNYTIDAENNKLKKTIFSLPDVIGLLAKYDIIIKD